MAIRIAVQAGKPSWRYPHVTRPCLVGCVLFHDWHVPSKSSRLGTGLFARDCQAHVHFSGACRVGFRECRKRNSSPGDSLGVVSAKRPPTDLQAGIRQPYLVPLPLYQSNLGSELLGDESGRMAIRYFGRCWDRRFFRMV